MAFSYSCDNHFGHLARLSNAYTDKYRELSTARNCKPSIKSVLPALIRLIEKNDERDLESAITLSTIVSICGENVSGRAENVRKAMPEASLPEAQPRLASVADINLIVLLADISVPKRCAAANPVMLSNTDLTIKRVWGLSR